MSELKKIIAEGEGQQLDFKFRIDDQKKIARTLAAFANTEGGRLLIGVKDNGKISGTNPEEEYYMIEGAAEMYCNPPVAFTSNVWQEEHHLVLVVDVPVSENKHKAKDENGSWKFYHRLDDHTLLCNKIDFLLWRYKNEGKDRPEVFDENALGIIKYIGECQPVSISKLFRFSVLPKSEVYELIATLIHWQVVSRTVVDSGIRYELME
jgi:predicted HTH transcriptional regulator